MPLCWEVLQFFTIYMGFTTSLYNDLHIRLKSKCVLVKKEHGLELALQYENETNVPNFWQIFKFPGQIKERNSFN